MSEVQLRAAREGCEAEPIALEASGGAALPVAALPVARAGAHELRGSAQAELRAGEPL